MKSLAYSQVVWECVSNFKPHAIFITPGQKVSQCGNLMCKQLMKCTAIGFGPKIQLTNEMEQNSMQKQARKDP
jgi:hypothetical protein